MQRAPTTATGRTAFTSAAIAMTTSPAHRPQEPVCGDVRPGYGVTAATKVTFTASLASPVCLPLPTTHPNTHTHTVVTKVTFLMLSVYPPPPPPTHIHRCDQGHLPSVVCVPPSHTHTHTAVTKVTFLVLSVYPLPHTHTHTHTPL